MDCYSSTFKHTNELTSACKNLSVTLVQPTRVHCTPMQCAITAGGWFNYVATLTVVERLAGERGLLVSLVLIVRMLPSLLLFPVAGVAADRSACVSLCIPGMLLHLLLVLK